MRNNLNTKHYNIIAQTFFGLLVAGLLAKAAIMFGWALGALFVAKLLLGIK